MLKLSQTHKFRPEDIEITSSNYPLTVELALRVWISRHSCCYFDERTINADIPRPTFGEVFYEGDDEGTKHAYGLYDKETETICYILPKKLDSYVYTYSQSEDLVKEFYLRLVGEKAFQKPSNRVHVTERSYGETRLKPFTHNITPLERGNYDDGILDQFDFMLAELSAEEPTGRLTIINGPPGTGKTHALQSVPCHINGAVIFGSPDFVTEIAQGNYLSRLESLRESYNSATCICIEDADECLAPRDGGNLGVISAVLNLTDGMLGRQLDLRIVLTTNSSVDTFEEALLRPGRLSQIIEIGALSDKKAREIARRLEYDEPISGKKTLAELYALSRGSKVRKRMASRVGFAC